VKGQSCSSNLLAFLDKVTDCVDKGIMLMFFFLDLAKAFDKVPHTRSMNKVRAHGIHGLISNWIEHWLKGRKQQVCISGAESSWVDVSSGVPQGSVLRPILFLIFVNDMDRGIVNWIMMGYKRIYRLQRLLDWSREWQMEFNIDKCKVMHIGRSNMNLVTIWKTGS